MQPLAPTADANALVIEASSVAVGEAGVLLLGEAGCGKSTLALRLVDSGAYLVADGKVVIYDHENQVMLTAPEAMHGKLAVKGLPEMSLPTMRDVPLMLAVYLSPAPESATLPEAFECLGHKIPVIAVNPADSAAELRIRTMVWHLNREG